MDSLTQIVLGAAVGEVVLGRKAGNKAMLYGAVAGTIPDLDVFVGNFYDTVTALEIHRGFSHSIVFSIILAPLLGFLLSKIHPQATWKNWSSLLFWGLFTHPLLDCFTTWGTQLFWPFDLRIALKSIFVIDPLYTLPFLICLIVASRYQRTSEKRSRFNRWGLIISSSYLILSLMLKGMAYSKFEKALSLQNITYSEIETRPSPFNTLLWSANVKTSSAFLIGEYSVFDSQPIQFRTYPKRHEKIEGLLKYNNLERLINITKGWFIISERGNQLYLNDLRFGLVSLNPKSEKFVFSYQLSEIDKQLKITEEPKNREDVEALFSELWKRIKGN
jgi:inner membrane protein